MTHTTETIRNLDAARMAIHDDCRQGCMTDWEYRQAAATARETIETCRKIATRIYVGVRETAIDLPDLGGAAKLKGEGVAVSALIEFAGH